jgi:predicted PurR-regulated permease PerM
MAALLEVVPTIGPTVTFIVVTLVALLISPILALKAGAVCAGVQLLENALLVPVVMAAAMKLDPVTVLLAIFIAGSLAGPLGVLVAIPLAVMIKVVLLYYYAEPSSPRP